MSSREIVKLNIGGTVFQTTKSTLTKFEGFFKTMFEIDIPIEKDEYGCVFVDRAPDHFKIILNYMRDGHVELPDSLQDVKEIRKEAEYYAMDGLIELCNARIPDERLRFIESDAEMLVIITNIVKPVLIFHYPNDNTGTVFYPKGFDVNCFFEKYQDQIDIYFKRRVEDPRRRSDRWAWTICESPLSHRTGHDQRKSWFSSDSDSDSYYDERNESSSFMERIGRDIEKTLIKQQSSENFFEVFAENFFGVFANLFDE